MLQEVFKETLAALVLLRVDMLRLASSSSESAAKVKKMKMKTVKRGFHYFFPRSNYVCKHFIASHLSDCIGQRLDDLVVRRGNDTLPIYFNDAVPNTNTSSLCYAATHQTADLQQEGSFRILQQSDIWDAPRKAAQNAWRREENV